jgi:hypothetical protein
MRCGGSPGTAGRRGDHVRSRATASTGCCG